jgi:hypothetical protein
MIGTEVCVIGEFVCPKCNVKLSFKVEKWNKASGPEEIYQALELTYFTRGEGGKIADKLPLMDAICKVSDATERKYVRADITTECFKCGTQFDMLFVDFEVKEDGSGVGQYICRNIQCRQRCESKITAEDVQELLSGDTGKPCSCF